MILDKFSLKGKCGLVTGAGAGIGRAMAQGLAQAGARVAIAGRNVEKLKNAAGQMEKAGLDVAFFRADISEPEDILALTGSVVEKFGHVDFLFNNAGMIHRDPLDQFPSDKWEAMIKVNLTGPFLLSRAVARHMIDNRIKGAIVNTSSLIAVFGGVNVPAYAATKGGVTQLTKSMCNDLAKYGIRVNAIGPGWVRTEMTQALQNDPDRNKAITGRIPLGRWAEPEDLAGLAVFLASDASAYITGQVIFIDGGYLAM